MSLEELEAIEAIKRLKYKYMRCIDRKEWEELADCFTEDATAAYSGGKYAYTGAPAILEFLSKAMGAPSFHSSHRVHHPEIELTSDTTATGTWALEDVVIESKLNFTLRGAAFYFDQYKKVDGQWKIKHTGYERTYEEMHMRDAIPGLKLTASGWEGDGSSEIDVD